MSEAHGPAVPDPPPEPERRYTLLLVPEDGRGAVVEHRFSVRQARVVATAAGGFTALLVLAAVVQVATLSRVLGHDEIVAENLAIKAELESTNSKLAELEPLVERVRAYDEQLRGMAARGALPGFGPLDEESMAARDQWIRGVVGDGAAGSSTLTSEELFAELQRIDFDALDQNLQTLEQASEAMPQLWPVEGVITSGFGWRHDPFARTHWKFHGGLDIGAEYGSPILATGAGVVTFSGWDSGHGRMVEVDHGGGISTRYCHASQLLVQQGNEVLAGETLALVGSSGMSTGPHLHYELFIDGEKVDPYPYLPAGGP